MDYWPSELGFKMAHVYIAFYANLRIKVKQTLLGKESSPNFAGWAPEL